MSNKIIHVAVGVIIRHDQVLICWRDASLHQGNRYEFPGGKLELGESPSQALKRELKEELNIDVQLIVSAQQLYFNYPEKTVCLHIFKVTEFTGQPIGQQSQAVLWVHKDQLANYRFPDANAPILRMLKLPEQYIITHALAQGQSTQHWLDWHIKHVPLNSWLYVREKTMSTEAYKNIIKSLSCARADLHLVADFSHIDKLSDQLEQLHGVHLSERHLMRLDQPLKIPPHLLSFAACHDQAAIAQANIINVDAILVSPLHPTCSHPQQLALGWKKWQALSEQSHVPVFALGGVAPADLTQVQKVGGFGVAGIRAFLSA